MKRQALARLIFVLLSCAGAPQYEVKGSCKDGLPDGSYELRLRGTGKLRVSGSFERGAKSGLFTFYDTEGSKIAEIPFAGDLPQGSVKVWYPPKADSGESGPLKLESKYAGGVRAGLTTTWYESGSKRSEHVYMGGVPRRAQYFGQQGEKTVKGADAAKLTEDDERDEREFFEEFGVLIRDHPVRCSES